MDIENAWDIKFIPLGDKTYALNEIEHEIIRKEFNEPRIHFVLVCAAISCPVLLNEAYISAKLDQQLQHQGELFINDPSKNSIKVNKANVSQLFNWFGDDFTKNTVVHWCGYLNYNIDKRFVTIQYPLKSANKSLLLGVSGGNVGGRDAEASLHGCIHGIFRKIYPVAVTIP